MSGLGLLLALSLLSNFTEAIVQHRRFTPLIDKNALSQWQDSAGRLAISAAWTGPGDPLTNAYRAFNASFNEQEGSRVSKTCLKDLLYVFRFPDLWAYKMVDSSVKIPEGLLAYSFTHLGNWEECVNVGYETPPAERFSGKMCLVGIQPVLGDECTREDKSDTENARGMQHAELISKILLKLGTCVPSTCTASDIQELFSYPVKDLGPIRGTCIKVSVGEDDCTTHDRPELDTSDWIAVGLLSGLGAIVVLSTVYDVLIPSFRRKSLLAAFSVVSNGKKLLAMPRGDGDQALSSLHGIRFLSMCWVVLCHSYLVKMYVPSLNPEFVLKFLEDWYRIGLMNGTLAVDTFFVLSGLLVGYLFFKQPSSNRSLNIPMYYLHRYIRLTPALAMIVLLNATLATRIGWGPMWTPVMKDIRESCQKNWWSTLLYVSNYVNPLAQCVDQGWYLMVDMQLHWLSPLVLLPLARWPRVGGILLGVLCVAGIVSNFVLSYLNEYAPIQMDTDQPDGDADWLANFYIPTHTRFVPYLEGMAIGYVLANQRSEGETLPPMTRSSCAIAWFSAASLLLIPLMTGIVFCQEPLPSVGWSAIYNSLFRPAWALGVGTVVYLCANNSGNPVNKFLSWWGFQFLGRLNYGVYLVHVTLQMAMAGAVKTSLHLDDSSILAQFAGEFALSLLLAVVLSLLCETPFIVLEKEIFGNYRRQNDSPRPVTAPVSSNAAMSEAADSSASVIEKEENAKDV